MHGRLTRLFILISFLGALNSQKLFGQAIDTHNSLSAKEQKIIKKRIKAIPSEEKILLFTCFDLEYTGKNNNTIAGVVLNPHSQEALHNLDTADLVKFINTASLKSFENLPFPTATTRKNSRMETPRWVPEFFGADYFLDINQAEPVSQFYGIDTMNNATQVLPYNSINELLPATLNHDLIYLPGDPTKSLNYIRNTKIKGNLKKQLDDKLKQKFTEELQTKKRVIKENIEKAEVLRWIWDVYTASVSTNDSGNLLPIDFPDGINICSFSFNVNKFESFNNIISKYALIPVYQARKNRERDISRLSAYDLILIPIAKPSKEKLAFIAAVAAKSRVIIVDFENRQALPTMDNIGVITVPENNWLSQTLAAQKILMRGETKTSSAMLRYGEPELVGLIKDSLMLIDLVITKAIQEKAIPGCQILVAKDGVVVWDKGYGYQTYDSLAAITSNTLYDLASITKVLATTQAIMFLLDRGKLALDEPLSHYLDYLTGTNKEAITIRQVMAHQAGLYPYYPFWKKAKEEFSLDKYPQNEKSIQAGRSLWVPPLVGDSILSWAATSDLLVDRVDTITHEQYFYSDIGFYLLKDLIEKQTRQGLDTFLNKNLYQPLGTRLRFNPTCYYPADDIAPTEIDNKLRHERLQGFVHDRNAALMGGVAGQAGLFGNANDVAKILQLQLNNGWYGDKQYYTPATVKQFLSRQYDNNRRALGWDRPGTEPDGPVSTLANDKTFGHSGFTGGSIWADPKENLIFVFLSNRVYPSAENTKLIDENIRTIVQDIVYRAIPDKELK